MGAGAHPPIRASFKSVRHLKTKMNKLTTPDGNKSFHGGRNYYHYHYRFNYSREFWVIQTGFRKPLQFN